MLRLCVLAALLAICSAVRPPSCPRPAVCRQRVTTECPNQLPDHPNYAECPTCCCRSTDNIDFYDSRVPEPICTAPPARYLARFVSTWTAECQPDYYPVNAHWSPLTGVSHNTSYEVWDACMYDVTLGVALVSQFGATTVIMREYAAQGDRVRDTFRGGRIDGTGDTSDTFIVDRDHQYVSDLTMIAPSLDRMMGVSLLRLCDGSGWKRYVKVCGELFSTATRSARKFDDRNSVQYSNCSFGYFDFTFLEYLDPLPSNFPGPLSANCQDRRPGVCPRQPFSPPGGCGTCCCRSSYVEYYNPIGKNSYCEADSTAIYRVTLGSGWTQRCHPEFYHPQESEFTPLVVVSHDPKLEIWNRCGMNPSAAVREYAEFGHLPRGSELLNRELSDNDQVYDTYIPQDRQPFMNGRRSKTAIIRTNADASYVTVLSKMFPSDLLVGVSRLQLCQTGGWRERVEVCLEPTALGKGYEQHKNCSFGTLTFELLRERPDPDRPERPDRPDPTQMPMMPDGEEDNTPMRVADLEDQDCCDIQFMFNGQLLRLYRQGKGYLGIFDVETSYYDEIGHIRAGKIVQVKFYGEPEGIDRLVRGRRYLLMGERECGSNELIITKRGVIENRYTPSDIMRCLRMKKSGRCDSTLFPDEKEEEY